MIIKLNKNNYKNWLSDLAQMLKDSVDGGASLGFVQPFSLQQALEFWHYKNQQDYQNKAVFIATENDEAIGTVTVITDLPNNQPHRAEISKLMVAPNHRGKGVSKQLMIAAEQYALTLNKSLIVLDTQSGSTAEKLYTSIGYIVSGTIPNFAIRPDNSAIDATTIMYKQLQS